MHRRERNGYKAAAMAVFAGSAALIFYQRREAQSEKAETELTEEGMEDWEVEYYKEYYPDTYGIGGGGTYFLRARPKTQEELKNNEDGKFLAREYPAKEQWMKAYHEMTGVDFYNLYWEGEL